MKKSDNEFICKECGKHYYDVEDGGICPDCLIKYIKDLEMGR